MSRAWFAPFVLALSGHVIPVHATWSNPFISELHYDNAGADVGEFVAVTGPSGLDLSGWQVVFYDGSDGEPYKAKPLSGTLDAAAADGLAELAFWISGIQNGPDAVALASPLDVVIDFVAYEREVDALDGVAAGLTAARLPVAEDGSTAVGLSLQRVGTADDADWVVAEATPGRVNPGLLAEPPGTLPSAGVGVLWLAGLAGWWSIGSRRRRHPRLA